MIKWNRLPDLPGMEQTLPLGVSASFVGIIDSQLVVAGGCNFPGKPVVEGGIKRYYAEIWALNIRDREAVWRCVGKLPHTVAYGAGVSISSQSFACLGGNNDNGSFSDAYMLQWDEMQQHIKTAKLPSLPAKMDNFAAAYAEDKIYIAGGNINGSDCNLVYCIDILNETKWQQLPDFPGPARVQPTLVVQSSEQGLCLYLSGGFQSGTMEMEPQIPTDVLSFSIDSCEWQTATSLPPLSGGDRRTLTGGCAIAWGDSSILYFGGVNYNRFLLAIDRPRRMNLCEKLGDWKSLEGLNKEKEEYLRHPALWYCFNDDIWEYNVYVNKWTNLGVSEFVARAGAGAVLYGNQLIVVNGEVKPGVRTPQVSIGTLP